MYHLDQRLSRILSDTGLEQAAWLRRDQENRNSRSARERIGILLIAQSEKLAGRQAGAA